MHTCQLVMIQPYLYHNTVQVKVIQPHLYHNIVQVKVKVSGAQQSATSLITAGTHMLYGITQCYLPPGSGDTPALTAAEAGTQLSDPGGMQG